MSGRILVGDSRDTLLNLADATVHCVVTSPPYFGLRDYGVPGQMGLEQTPDEYVAEMVSLFSEVRRVLRDDGTLWLNLGDSYAANRSCQVARTKGGPKHGPAQAASGRGQRATDYGLKPKDLIGIPWRVAFALQADGWYLRQDIIWHKPNPMPESVRDRCTKAHEYIFMFSKSPRYFYDHEAIKTPAKESSVARIRQATFASQSGGEKDYANGVNPNRSMRKTLENWAKHDKQRGHGRRHAGFNARWDSMSKSDQMALGANKRSVWSVATKPFKGAHFATYPPELIEPCILAGCPAGGTVLDPFFGAGTTGLVAESLGRNWIGCELNPEYAQIARQRIYGEIVPSQPLVAWLTAA